MLRQLVGSSTTTPGRLRLARTALVLGLLVSGAVGVYTADDRADAAREIAGPVQQLSADATELYRSLADADTTVAREFLSGETAAAAHFRDPYDEDIALAARSLARAGTHASPDDMTADRIADITAALPVYAGIVEQARNRQDLPVVDDLQRASDLMQLTILHEAEELLRSQAERLDEEYERAVSAPVLALVLGAASLAGLVWLQVSLARRTKRVFNGPLVTLSTAAVVGALLWWAIASAFSHSYLEGSHVHSQSVTDALVPAQIAALQARGSESLALLARDGGSTEQEFDNRVQILARADGAGGALGAARQFSSDAQGRALVEAAIAKTRTYLAAHDEVRRLDDGGHYREAVDLAVGPDVAGAAETFSRLDDALAAAVAYERASFDSEIGRARGWLTGLLVGPGLLALVAVIGVAWGVNQRLRDYR
ncbi:MAG: hypothetical protein ACRDRZ_06625 [Pseudonocardiaceae bacterium]